MGSEQWGRRGFADLFFKDAWEGSESQWRLLPHSPLVPLSFMDCEHLPRSPLWRAVQYYNCWSSCFSNLPEIHFKDSWLCKMWVTICLKYSKGENNGQSQGCHCNGWRAGLGRKTSEHCSGSKCISAAELQSWKTGLVTLKFQAHNPWFGICLPQKEPSACYRKLEG